MINLQIQITLSNGEVFVVQHLGKPIRY